MATTQEPPRTAVDMETLYQTRLNRYVTALQNGKPDMVPIRPFVAEFTGSMPAIPARRWPTTTNWPSPPPASAPPTSIGTPWCSNMVYGWTGLTQAIGLKYYGIPGIDIPANTGFQYREPPQDNAYMQPEEYDALIEDPAGFLLNVWLPRVSRPSRARRAGHPAGNTLLPQGRRWR